MNDKVVRSLLIVVLILGAAVLAELLLGWTVMTAMMAGGMMDEMMGGGAGMMGQGWTTVMGLVSVLVVAGVVAALIWALRSPPQQSA
jgi:hypothetical protein